MSRMLMAVMAVAILALRDRRPAAPSDPTLAGPADRSADQTASRFTPPPDAAPTDAPEKPQTQDEPTAGPAEPTEEPKPAEEPTEEPATDEPEPAPWHSDSLPEGDLEPKPTPVIDSSGRKATPTPEPDPTPRPKRAPRPRAQDPEHPDGLDGCKHVGTFRDHESLKYQDWCGDALAEHISEVCEGRRGTGAQRQCGLDVVEEYDSILYRLGPVRCYPIDDGGDRDACLWESLEAMFAAQADQGRAWERIRVAAEQAPEVQNARADTLACLEEAGHRDVEELLFHWQHGFLPEKFMEREERLTRADKDRRKLIHEPSRTCARQHGLFAAQDAAWLAELRRLQEAEAHAVAALIREGFLEALERPGEPTFITADPSPHKTP